MSIIRVKKDKNYFAASNEPFNDTKLTWEARGVMGYLLSKPDDWQVVFYDLVKQSPAGEYKVRSILKELEERGYLERNRLKAEDGKFYWLSTIYETISRLPTYGATTDGLPTGGLSTDGKPRDIVSTELKKTDKKNINKKNGGKPPRKRDTRLDHPAIIAYREEAHLHVPINIRDDVVTVVDDAEKWQEIVHSWIGKGWNKQNIEGMLEVYRNGWRSGGKTNEDAIMKVAKERGLR